MCTHTYNTWIIEVSITLLILTMTALNICSKVHERTHYTHTYMYRYIYKLLIFKWVNNVCHIEYDVLKYA